MKELSPGDIGLAPLTVVVSIFADALLVAAMGAAIGAGTALGLGALAALFPALRAARLPVATALQVR